MEKIIQFDRVFYGQMANTYRRSIYPAQQWVDAYNSLEALPDITGKTFEKFISDPEEYYENQVLALKKKRFGNDPIDLDQFKKLYRLELPNLHSVPKGDVLEMVNGKIRVKEAALKELEMMHTRTTSDPELIEKLEAIESLVNEYDKVYSLLFGDEYPHLKHDFKEIGFSRNTGKFLNEVVVKFVK